MFQTSALGKRSSNCEAVSGASVSPQNQKRRMFGSIAGPKLFSTRHIWAKDGVETHVVMPEPRSLVKSRPKSAVSLAVRLTTEYVKERRAFGKALIEFQNTRFVLAEAKTTTTIARTFLDRCIQALVNGTCDTVLASMAKYWTSDMQCKVIDDCLQLFGGYGYMMEYPIAQMFADARVQRIYAGTNEIMKELIARSL